MSGGPSGERPEGLLAARSDAAPLALLCAVNALLVLAFFSLARTNLPNTGDEHSILFQARIFAGFHWTAPAPPQTAAFVTDYIGFRDGRWFSLYPPLYALLLALGVLAGLPELVPAVVSSLTLAATFLLVKEAYRDRTLAWATALILLVSPSFRFYSASYYTHVGSSLAAVGILLAAARLMRDEAPGPGVWLLLAGSAAAGLAIRPFEIFWILLPVGAVAAARRLGKLQAFLATAALLCIPWILDLALAAAKGHSEWLDLVNSGGKLSVSRGLRPAAALRVLGMLADTAKWLLGAGVFVKGNLKELSPGDWNLSAPLLLAAVGYAAWEARKDEARRGGHLLFLAVVVWAAAGHLFYDKKGGRFGERRLLEVLPLLAVFCARLFQRGAAELPRAYLAPVAVALFGFNLACYLPGTLLYYRDANDMRFVLYDTVELQGVREGIVAIRDYPELYPAWYARNAPDLSGVVFVNEKFARIAAETLPLKPRYLFLFNPYAQRYELRRLSAGPLTRPIGPSGA